MTDLPEKKIMPLDPRGALDRLVRVFETGEEGGLPSLPREDTVVPLNDDDDVPSLDNPFAKEAAESLAFRRLEALLFASPKPLSEAFLQERIGGQLEIRPLLEMLQEDYDSKGVNLRVVDRKWQFVTAPDIADVLVEERTQERKLSRAALETLAIIAYHQPSSRADIEEVRGVAVAKGSLDQLLELGWIKIKGRREVPGRPLVYGTTPAFLEHFGLEDISHLPGMADLKAAGLLDARLPPGFSVPSPKDDDGEDESADTAMADDATFTEDFHEEE